MDLDSNFTNPSASMLANQVEIVEHLQATAQLSEDRWLELLQMSWKDYFSFRAGQKKIDLKTWENLANYFEVPIEKIFNGEIDYRGLSVARTLKNIQMPDPYLVSPHGRLRSTITSIDFLEYKYGWRLRSDVLKKFNLFESHLQNAFAPISIRLITEVCDYLHKRQFKPDDFFQMGVYSYQGNQNSILSKLYSDFANLTDVYEFIVKNVMPLFEENCHYTFDVLKNGSGLITMKSNPEIAAALKVKHLGSPHLCYLKGGIWASTALYLGLNLPQVTHPKCEHRGDGICHYHLDFSTCTPIAGKH